VSGSADTADPAANLLSAVAQAYGVTAPFHAKRLSGGYANDVFLLDGDRPVVLHVKHPPVDLNSLTWEHQLTAIGSRVAGFHPRKTTTQDGRTFFLHQERPVWLTPYVPGVPATPSDRRAVAAALGSLHSIKIDITARPGHPRLSDLPIPQISQMPAAFDGWLPLIRRARDEALELITEIGRTRSVVAGVTHNDIFPGNVLVDDGHVTSLLDWEEADVDWQVWDLASSIGPFCSTTDGALDGKAAEEYIDSYRAAGGQIPPNEDDLIVPLVRVKRILEVLRAPTDRHPQWDYQLANLKAYQLLG